MHRASRAPVGAVIAALLLIPWTIHCARDVARMPLRFDSTDHMPPETRFRTVDAGVVDVAVRLVSLVEQTGGEVLDVERESLYAVGLLGTSSELFAVRADRARRVCEAVREDDAEALAAIERATASDPEMSDVEARPVGTGRATVVQADLAYRWIPGIFVRIDQDSWEYHDVVTRSRATFVLWRDPDSGRTRIYASARPVVGSIVAGTGHSVPHWLVDEVDGTHEAFVTTAFLDRLAAEF